MISIVCWSKSISPSRNSNERKWFRFGMNTVTNIAASCKCWAIIRIVRIIRCTSTSLPSTFHLFGVKEAAHWWIWSLPEMIHQFTQKERLIRSSRPAYLFQFLFEFDATHINRILWTRCKPWIYYRISTEENPILTYSIINSTARTQTPQFYPFPKPQYRR